MIRYIERAAAANHPEGMYNLGVFHEQGIAGLEANPQLALEYFMRAAEHPRPFNMALFALGNYYRFGKGGVSAFCFDIVLTLYYKSHMDCYLFTYVRLRRMRRERLIFLLGRP